MNDSNDERHDNNEVVASLIRVRNRLGRTPDEALPKILAGLLPRLLRRLEDYEQEQQEDETTQVDKEEKRGEFGRSCRRSNPQMLSQLAGILSQALQRLEQNYQLPATPWMESILPFLSVMTTTTTPSSRHINLMTVTFALKFLQTGLARYQHREDAEQIESSTTRPATTNACLKATSKTLFCLVDALYHHQQQHQQELSIEMDPHDASTESTTPTFSLVTAQRNLWFMASWLCLDVIAINQGMTPFQDWDTDDTLMNSVSADQDKTQRDNDTKSNISTTTTAAMTFSLGKANEEENPTVGDGVMDLMLDVLLFWPEAESSDFVALRRFMGLGLHFPMANMNPRQDPMQLQQQQEERERFAHLWRDPPPENVPEQILPAAADQQHQEQQEPFLNQHVLMDEGEDNGMDEEMARDDEELVNERDPLEPNERQLRQNLPIWMRRRMISKRGLSSEGEYRITYRQHLSKTKFNVRNRERGNELRLNHHWNQTAILYLKQLKYACLKACIGETNGGLFQGDGALLLAVVAMSSSSNKSTHNRLAVEYITRLSRKEQQEEKPKPSAYLQRTLDPQKRQKQQLVWKDKPYRVSLAVTCSLMVLMVGDLAANPVLNQFDDASSVWETIIGPRPKSVNLPHCRPPLPTSVAGQVVDFIASLLSNLSTGTRLKGCNMILDLKENNFPLQGVMLFLSLIVAGEPVFRRDNLWLVHLAHGMYHRVKEQCRNHKEYNDDWVAELSQKCFDIAMNHLSIIARWSAEINPDTHLQQLREQQQDADAIPFLGFPLREHEVRLLQQHRTLQKNEILARSTGLQVRECAYNLLSDLAKGTAAQRTVFGSDSDQLSFALPTLLFTCAEVESAEGKEHVAVVLATVLNAYRRHILEHVATAEQVDLEALAAPLLRTLVSAACSDSTVIRLASAKWASQLLAHMDPMSAYTLGRFMVEDPNPAVSQYVAREVWFSSLDNKVEERMKEIPAAFIDLSNDVERSVLEAEVGAQVQKVVESLEIPVDAASLLLHDFDFKVEEAIKSTKTDRHGTFEKTGLSMRCDKRFGTSESMKFDAVHTCGICYDDFTEEFEMYSLPCHHEFCVECWKSFVNSALEESLKNALVLTCPSQDCSERLALDDLRKIGDINYLPIWQRTFLHSFVERSQKRLRFCPGPDCTMIAVAPQFASASAVSRAIASVKCSQCKTQFCLSCGEPPHIPARCQDMIKFHRMYSSTTFWMQKNTKPCPGCNANVNKDGGCNAMICTQCRASFCWLCLSLVDAHLPHTCNRYNAGLTSDGKRFIFYSDRYNAHDHAEHYAQTQIANVEERAADVSNRVWNLLEGRDLVTFRVGLETLVRARHFLKNSYVYSFGNSKSGSAVFESHQGALEASTEGLSRLSELDVDTIHNRSGAQGVRNHFKALGLYTAFVTNSMERMLALENE